MSAGHTKGPWAVEELTDGVAFGKARSDGSLETIISFVSTKDYHRSAHTRYVADFTLAAAAPELLKASEMALKALVGVDELMHRYGMMEGVDCPAIPVLHAAIAKALGQ